MMLEKTKRHLGVTTAETREGRDSMMKALRQVYMLGNKATMDKVRATRKAFTRLLKSMAWIPEHAGLQLVQSEAVDEVSKKMRKETHIGTYKKLEQG